MYICMHVYLNVDIYICICGQYVKLTFDNGPYSVVTPRYVHIYIDMYLYLHVYLNIDIYIYILICIYICKNTVLICIYMYLLVCLNIHVYIYIYSIYKVNFR
jgi:hypothetical protein